MKRFLLFSFAQYYPAGGRGDVVGDFDTLEEAVAAARGDNFTWGQSFDLLDLEAREWVEIPAPAMEFKEGPPVDLSDPED